MDGNAITPPDRSRVAQVVIWFLLLTAVSGVVARLSTKWAMSRKLFVDDMLIIAAQISHLAQAIAVSSAAGNGLGKSVESLTDDQLDRLLKAEYASIPLLLLTLALVKWSISDFIRQLTPSDGHLYVDLGLRILVGLWLVSGTFVSLFRCGLPMPWNLVDDGHCIDMRAWWTTVGVISVVTEIGYMALFVWIIGRLQMPLLRRATILIVFLLRISVVGTALAQLVVYWNVYDVNDVSSSLYLPTILNQVVLCCSIVTACLPYLKPLMASLESGIVRVPDEADELAFMPSTKRSSKVRSSRAGSDRQ